MQSRRVLSICLQGPFEMLNVPRAAVTESPAQLAVVDQRSFWRDAPPKWNLPATTRLQHVGARSGMKNCLQATSWRTRIHSCPVLMSWQQILLDSCNGCGGSASKIDDAWVQFRFCARHFVPMVPPAVIKIRMRPTHKGQGNDAVGRVTLPKWCRKKGDLRRVESQVSKL